MTRYSVQSRDRIFVKGYGFLSFAKNIGENTGKNISKHLSGKYSPGMLAMHQKLLDHAKKSATNFIVNKSANRITKVSKNSQWNNSKTVTNKHNEKIPKERYISPEERQDIIDNLRLK